jgi:putative transcriptional regulator
MTPRLSQRLGVAALLAALAAPLTLSAQVPRPVNKLGAGKFLVARRDLPDPNFAESVVVLIQYDRKGAMGFIINRRTKVEVSRLFQGLKLAAGRKDPVYMGGPVGIEGVLGLLRTATKPEDARPVFPDIYVVSSKETLEKALSAGGDPNSLRIYLGYSGWGAGQLEGEVELGMWHIFEADPAVIFEPDPSRLWERLVKQTELRIARVRLRIPAWPN